MRASAAAAHEPELTEEADHFVEPTAGGLPHLLLEARVKLAAPRAPLESFFSVGLESEFSEKAWGGGLATCVYFLRSPGYLGIPTAVI